MEEMAGRFREIQEEMATADPEQYTLLLQEYQKLAPIMTVYQSYDAARREYEEAEELAKEDASFQEMCDTAKREMETQEARLDQILTPKDPNDEKNVIMEIRAGAGGEEAALFGAALYRMYDMYAASKGWKTERLSANETQLGGYKEITFQLTGTGAYAKLKYESGVHRVQRVPETESGGRIHTSTVTVAVLPEVDDVAIDILPTDLKIDVFRASGAGGQHINKTESAVRVTHLPTGITVECQDERSQYANKDRAMKVLRARLYDKMTREQNDKIASERRQQIGTADRSQRIRTYNFPQGRLTDHRIGFTLYTLNAIMNGNLDELLDELHRKLEG